ncbi:hypothetical protein CCR75_003248 [Bremia lactucae]|uniref:BCNT-C domain-containing protein n=1 Tax=Bremia lactucae TaxID=4779 RepID=A0A976FKU9_BRELC|nr:hypothetical protein CCR75_003248 [Bremia lactucae]
MVSSDEDDDDYVPEASQVDLEEDKNDVNADGSLEKRDSVKTNSDLDQLWEDMNVPTSVSKMAADKTAKLLCTLTKKTKCLADKNQKRKLREFAMPILGVDVKRSRRDLTETSAIKQKAEQVIKFAGKEYKVSTRGAVTRGEKGLDKVLASFDEPRKVSTIEKSSLDWDTFKEVQGIEDELTHLTKDGYLEKQEFLQRLDQKRFDIEKAEREKQRKLQQLK